MILTSRQSYASARLIQSYLEERLGHKLAIRSYPLPGKQIHVRYGCSDNPELGGINTPEFIRLCSFKRDFSRLLTEHNVNCVQFFKNERPSEYPILCRESLSLSGGRGIHIVRNEEEFNSLPRMWWTPFVRTQSEFRVHIVGGEVVKVFKKVLADESSQEEEFPIRNMHRGYHFRLVTQNLPKLIEFSNQVDSVIQGDFYALDIGYVGGGQYIAFEANSAPGLNDNTTRIYGEYLYRKVFLNENPIPEEVAVRRAGGAS